MAEKLTVSLCTSGSRFKLALEGGGRSASAVKKGLNQENFLFPSLRALLCRRGAALSDIKAIRVVRGPGRFTGIRIALTFGRVLSGLSGANLRGVTVFEILAWQAFNSPAFRRLKPKPARIGVCLHAFKEEFFCQLFSAGARLAAAGEPVWLRREEVKGFFEKAGPGAFYIADEEEYPGIYGLTPPGAGRAPAAVSKILPASIAPAALALGSASAEPLYLKPAKYELDRKAAKKC